MEDNEKKLDAVEEAQIVSELSNKVAKLEAENAELQAAKKKYYDRLLNNNDPEPEQKVMHTDEEIQSLRESLFSEKRGNLSDLGYVEKALELRDAILEKTDGKTDIFVGSGSKYAPTQEDYFRAQNTAETLKECVEYADGDSQIFLQEVQRRISGR